MPDFSDNTKILSEPFDVKTHQKAFKNTYFETVIAPDGTVRYAVPCHQEILIRLACEKLDFTREQLNAACPKKYYYDFLTWLVMQSGGYVPCWTNMVFEPVNQAQHDTLKMLKDEHIYNGDVPTARQAEWDALVRKAPDERVTDA